MEGGPFEAVLFADFVFEVAGVGEVEAFGVAEEEGEFWWVDVDLAGVHEFGLFLLRAGGEVFVDDALEEGV